MVQLREWAVRRPLVLWRACAAVALLFLLAGTVLSWVQWRERASASTTLETKRAAIRPLSPDAHAASVPETFVATLPPTAQAEQIVQRLVEAALTEAVVLADSRIEQPRTTSEAELPRATLSFLLRGSYPAIKATLARTLARTGHATLHSLSVRSDFKSEVEAQVVLSLWLQPVQALAR